MSIDGKPGISMKENDTRSAAERLLDQAIEYTFPASDPIAVGDAFASALEREENASNTPNPATKSRPAER